MTDEHEHAMKVWREADRAGEDAYVEAVETGTTAVEAHEAGNQAAAAVIAGALSANAAKLAELRAEIEALRGDVGGPGGYLDAIKHEALTAGAPGYRTSAKAFAHIVKLCNDARAALGSAEG